MYYILLLLLFGLLLYVFVKILSSLVKAALVAGAISLLVMVVLIMYKSTKAPVSLFGLYEVDNFELRRTL